MITAREFAQANYFPGLWSFLERIADRPWATAVELLLIGGVVFAVLRFFQGTRGARLVRALLAIVAISFAVVRLIAEQFELERLNVLYPYFILGVFLVSLVAFQAELRRMLVKLGEGGWLRRWWRSETSAVEQIVTALERLSEKKIGALIAIERRTEMGAWAESGVCLDAQVTRELLETIFWPGTALHDLGVIVRQDRIAAAGCQFPLTDSGEVDRSLGSRHRAAIGMSEEIDAVVVVVSEETGTISVALEGRLRRGLTAATLRDLLYRELACGPQKEKPEARSAPRASRTMTEATRDGEGQTA